MNKGNEYINAGGCFQPPFCMTVTYVIHERIYVTAKVTNVIYANRRF